ncbi:MAG: hypothetical protein AAF628_03385 [Planctomycetota bacterium]
MKLCVVLSCLPVTLILAGCGEAHESTREVSSVGDPWKLVLAPVPGPTPLDERIATLQRRIPSLEDPTVLLEQLGSLFIVKARSTYDPGFYRLAELCAVCIEGRDADATSAKLLRGHVAHSLHRFVEAEDIAQELVARRGNFHDFGLLGDVQLDRGDLDAALASYQKMADLKPCLQSYARAARLCWLRGDLEGARELFRMAKGAGSVRAPEALAWTYGQLAEVELQAGDVPAAKAACDAALALMGNAAPALLVRARIAGMEDRHDAALRDLRLAAVANPLPEYQWALADQLRRVGQDGEAEAVEAELERRGAREDPRTFALYLASRGRRVADALRLTAQELEARQDVHTWDARAWALLRAGRAAEAWQAMQKALGEGTADARLYYHAGAIAKATGLDDEGRRYLDDADELRRMLLPMEQRDLAALRRAH